jgi:hypothetical protein
MINQTSPQIKLEDFAKMLGDHGYEPNATADSGNYHFFNMVIQQLDSGRTWTSSAMHTAAGVIRELDWSETAVLNITMLNWQNETIAELWAAPEPVHDLGDEFFALRDLYETQYDASIYAMV